MSHDAFSERAHRLLGQTVLGGVRVASLLTETAAGAEYAATDATGASVMVRTVYPEVAARLDTLAQLEREVLVGRAVTHANVAAATDFGNLPDGTRLLVFSHPAGYSLRQILTQGPIAPDRAVRITEQLAAGLGALHEHSVMHANLCPEAIAVYTGAGGREIAAVGDFSSAELPDEILKLAQQGAVSKRRLRTPVSARGSAAVYCAPELAAGQHATPRSDLYSLGIVLFEMCTGAPPPLASEPPPLSHLCPSAPAGLDDIAQSLLARDPTRRPESAAALQSALTALALRPISSPALPALTPAVTAFANEVRIVVGGRGSEAPPLWPLPPSVLASLGGMGLILCLVLVAVAAREEPFKGDRFVGYDVAAADDEESETDESTPNKGDKARPQGTSTGGLPDLGLGAVTKKPADPFEINKLIARMNKERVTGKFGQSIDTLRELVSLDPTVIHRQEVKSATLSMCDQAMLLGPETQEKMFKMLTNEAGTAGYDILWLLVTTKGGSKSAKLAGQLLADESNRDRAGPDIQYAYTLRYSKNCPEKLELYPKVVKDGGFRTLTELRRLLDVADRTRYAEACPGHKEELRKAIKILEERTRGN